MIDDKIRKLLAMADDPAATAEEAASFAAKAAELAMQYSIDLAKLRKTDTKTHEAVSYSLGGLAASGIPGDRQALVLLAAGLGSLYGTFNIGMPSHNEFKVYFAGQEHTILLSQKWMSFLWESCKKANLEHAKIRTGLGQNERYKLDRSFRLMFAAAVYKRLMEKRDAMRKHGVTGGSDGKAVTLWLDNERKEIQLWVEQNTGAKTQEVKIGHKDYDDAAAHAGSAAGKRVSLDDQLASGEKKPQISEQRRLTC